MDNEEVKIEETQEETPDVAEELATEPPEGEAEEGKETAQVISFGDDTPEEDPEPAPEWVKDLRKQNRKLARENADLKKSQVKTDELPPLGAKPTLEASGYDEDKFATAIEDWHAEKLKHTADEKAKETKIEDQTRAWNARLGEYGDAKAVFESDDMDDAEATVKGALSDVQQGVMIEALGKGAAPLIMGLASDATRLKALAGITNPIRFAVEVARLESIMKKSPRKPRTSPERRIVGTAPAGVGDTTLEKLEAEAEKTGNRTKVLEFKRNQRAAS